MVKQATQLIRVDSGLHYLLKIQAAKEGSSLQGLNERIIIEYLKTKEVESNFGGEQKHSAIPGEEND